MTQHAEDVLQAALALAENERAEIASALLESLELDMGADVEKAWREEVAARVRALDDGEVKTIPLSKLDDSSARTE